MNKRYKTDKLYRVAVRGDDLLLGNECEFVRYRSTPDAALEAARELKEYLDSRPGVTRYVSVEIREYLYVRSISVP